MRTPGQLEAVGQNFALDDGLGGIAGSVRFGDELHHRAGVTLAFRVIRRHLDRTAGWE